MKIALATSPELPVGHSDAKHAGKGAVSSISKQREPDRSQEHGRSLPGFPAGWFAVGFSHELSRGQMLSRQCMGQQLVLFRTQSGLACAVDAYCPHLGAHFSYGGTVLGEVIRCPFHGFCFDQRGACVATGYGTKPPPAARLRTWPLRETSGMLLCITIMWKVSRPGRFLRATRRDGRRHAPACGVFARIPRRPPRTASISATSAMCMGITLSRS